MADENHALLEAYARAALPAYGVPADARLTLLNVSENATFRLDDASGASIIRVHREGYHSKAAIESELAWIAALRSSGVVRTPPFYETTAGERVALGTIVDGSSRHVVRFGWVDGVEPTEDRLLEDFEQLGSIAARLHGQARSWAAPTGFTRFTWDAETGLGASGHWGSWRDGMGMEPDILEVLDRAADRVRERLASYGMGPDRFGLIHADMRLANLLVNGPDVTVIDFDDCGFSWYMYDLGSAVSFFEHESHVPDLCEAWVRGYRTVAPLDPEDEAEIPTFVMYRRLVLIAWIGSHSTTDLAQSMGVQYTADTVPMAQAYLSGSFLR